MDRIFKCDDWEQFGQRPMSPPESIMSGETTIQRRGPTLEEREEFFERMMGGKAMHNSRWNERKNDIKDVIRERL